MASPSKIPFSKQDLPLTSLILPSDSPNPPDSLDALLDGQLVESGESSPTSKGKKRSRGEDDASDSDPPLLHRRSTRNPRIGSGL